MSKGQTWQITRTITLKETRTFFDRRLPPSRVVLSHWCQSHTPGQPIEPMRLHVCQTQSQQLVLHTSGSTSEYVGVLWCFGVGFQSGCPSIDPQRTPGWIWMVKTHLPSSRSGTAGSSRLVLTVDTPGSPAPRGILNTKVSMQRKRCDCQEESVAIWEQFEPTNLTNSCNCQTTTYRHSSRSRRIGPTARARRPWTPLIQPQWLDPYLVRDLRAHRLLPEASGQRVTQTQRPTPTRPVALRVGPNTFQEQLALTSKRPGRDHVILQSFTSTKSVVPSPPSRRPGPIPRRPRPTTPIWDTSLSPSPRSLLENTPTPKIGEAPHLTQSLVARARRARRAPALRPPSGRGANRRGSPPGFPRPGRGSPPCRCRWPRPVRRR